MIYTLIKNIGWNVIGRIIFIALGLISNMIFARKITVEEFGIVSIVIVMVGFSRVFIESGVLGALIRSPKISKKHLSTVFLMNVSICLAFILILNISASRIALYYQNIELEYMLRFVSLTLFFYSLQIIPLAMLERRLLFDKKNKIEIVSMSLGVITGIVGVYIGFGAWAILLSNFIFTMVNSILLWTYYGVRFPLIFDKEIFREIKSFSLNTTISTMLIALSDNVLQLVLPKYFSIRISGLYFQSKKIQELVVNTIQTSLLNVLYSFLSKQNSGNEKVNSKLVFSLRLFFVLILFICSIFFVLNKVVIWLILGDSWLETTWFLEIFVITGFFYLLEMFFRMIYKILNLTSIIPKVEVVKRIILFTLLIYSINMGEISILMHGVLWSQIIALLLYVIVSFKKLDLKWNTFIKELLLLFGITFSWILINQFQVLYSEVFGVILVLFFTVLWTLSEKNIRWELSKELRKRF